MARRQLTNNQKAAVIGTVAGILMLLAGFSGAARLDRIMDLLRKVIGSETWLKVTSFVLVSIASLGGVLVILGSVLFSYNRILSGRVLVWLWTGFGVVGFVLFLAVQFERIDSALASGAGLKLAGIVLAVVAQLKARAVPRRK